MIHDDDSGGDDELGVAGRSNLTSSRVLHQTIWLSVQLGGGLGI